MREESFVFKMRAALGRQGVWGSRAERLLQEWTDHVREDVIHRVEEGADPVSAEAAAWRALGSPDELAAHAARELAAGTWIGRHPWLAGLVMPVLVLGLTLATVLFGGAWLGGLILNTAQQQFNLSILEWWARTFNWLPWLLAMAWLAWVAVRMPGGWKLFWITAVALTLCSTAFQMNIKPPLNGPGSGQLNVLLSGPGGLLLGGIARLFAGEVIGPWSGIFSGVTQWVQSLLLVAGSMLVKMLQMRQPLRSYTRFLPTTVVYGGLWFAANLLNLMLVVAALWLISNSAMAETTVDTNHLGALVEAAKKSHSDALVIWQDGKPLLEWYGDGKARKIEAMSVTKSVVSLAVGRLLTQTKIRSLDQPVADFYPEWKQGQKAKITIRHLMNHTSGLQNVLRTDQEIYPSPDFVQLALCAELENPPGTTFSYNNKAANLLAGVVQKASGKGLDDYLRDELFAQLGITDFTWTRDRAGNPHAMSGLQILPADLAKLGQFALNRGQWNGQTLIEASFFDAALQPGQPLEASCGLLWWLMYDRTTWILDEQQFQKLRAAGVTPSWLEKIKGAEGQYTSGKDVAIVLERTLGPNWRAEFAGELKKHGLQAHDLFRKEYGKIIGYQANGYLGQYLLIYPDARLVCVRMIESKTTYNEATDGWEDLNPMIQKALLESTVPKS